jgi:hypothetical protein
VPCVQPLVPQRLELVGVCPDVLVAIFDEDVAVRAGGAEVGEADAIAEDVRPLLARIRVEHVGHRLRRWRLVLRLTCRAVGDDDLAVAAVDDLVLAIAVDVVDLHGDVARRLGASDGEREQQDNDGNDDGSFGHGRLRRMEMGNVFLK